MLFLNMRSDNWVWVTIITDRQTVLLRVVTFTFGKSKIQKDPWMTIVTLSCLTFGKHVIIIVMLHSY